MASLIDDVLDVPQIGVDLADVLAKVVAGEAGEHQAPSLSHVLQIASKQAAQTSEVATRHAVLAQTDSMQQDVGLAEIAAASRGANGIGHGSGCEKECTDQPNDDPSCHFSLQSARWDSNKDRRVEPVIPSCSGK